MANPRRHYFFSFCLAVSVALLILFFVLQQRDSPLLKLEAKWIIVAGVPILIGLILGNYIKTFKGFGIELESLLEVSIGRIDLIASEVADVIPGDEKRSHSYLNSLSDSQKRKIQRLTFTISKADYYSEQTVYTYLHGLRNLKYIEARDGNKRFHSLIPIGYFKTHRNIEHQRIREFIQALETNTLENLLGNNLITNFVKESEPLLDVLKKVRNSPFRVLPVVSSDKVFIGVVTVRLIEKRIADEVVAMQRNAA